MLNHLSHPGALFHAVLCNLFHPAAHHARQKKNLKQDGLCLTVRSCTAEFHQDMNVPVAPKVLKLASGVLWQPYLGSMWQEDA